MVSESHVALHAPEHMTGVDRSLTVFQAEELMHLPGTDFGAEREVEMNPFVAAPQGLEIPDRIRGFTVGLMHLAAIGLLIGAERGAEKIPA
jgi:hypothetical protein